ncbi:MAG: CotH kinase family protein [Proteobacteria bacterium]|nr:CotH kinase family protein [Pseudomonadota bacterium]
MTKLPSTPPETTPEAPTSLSERGVRRLVVANAALWAGFSAVVLGLAVVVGPLVLEAQRPAVRELGGLTALAGAQLGLHGPPLTKLELDIEAPVLRAASLLRPGARDAASVDRRDRWWFPAELVAAERQWVEVQLEDSSTGEATPVLRVRLTPDAQPVLGLREFVLAPAAADGRSFETAAQAAARRLGLAMPSTHFVSLQINGAQAGLYALTETLGPDFLRRVGAPARELVVPAAQSARTDATSRRLQQFERFLREASDADFAERVGHWIGVDALLKQSALMLVTGTNSEHSWRQAGWYLDPVTGLLQPVPVALGSAARPLAAAAAAAIPADDLLARLLETPRYRALRNRWVWKLVADPEFEWAVQMDAELARTADTLLRELRPLSQWAALQRIATVRGETRATLNRNATLLRQLLASSRIETHVERDVVGNTAVLSLELTPRGLAEIDVSEIRLELGEDLPAAVAEASLAVWNPAGDAVVEASITPRVTGSQIALPLRAVTLARSEAGTPWRVELQLPFFPADAWREAPVYGIELASRNAVTGDPLPKVALATEPFGTPEQAPVELWFRDVADVIAESGLPLQQRGDVLTLPAGRYTLAETLIVPPAHQLVLAPGTTLLLGEGVSLITFRGLHAEGTRERPIRFVPADPDRPWGAVAVVRAPETSSLAHVFAEGGSSGLAAGLRLEGQLAFHASDVVVRDAEIRGSHRGDGLSIQRGRFEVARTAFLGNRGDGLASRDASGFVRDSLFAHNADDGLDLASSRVRVQGSAFRDMRDKAISAGRRSELALSDSYIVDSQVAVASKEDSVVDVVRTEFRRNGLAVSLRRDAPAFGGGQARVVGGLFAGNRRDFEVDPGSQLELEGVDRAPSEAAEAVAGLPADAGARSLQ